MDTGLVVMIAFVVALLVIVAKRPLLFRSRAHTSSSGWENTAELWAPASTYSFPSWM